MLISYIDINLGLSLGFTFIDQLYLIKVLTLSLRLFQG